MDLRSHPSCDSHFADLSVVLPHGANQLGRGDSFWGKYHRRKDESMTVEAIGEPGPCLFRQSKDVDMHCGGQEDGVGGIVYS